MNASAGHLTLRCLAAFGDFWEKNTETHVA